MQGERACRPGHRRCRAAHGRGNDPRVGGYLAVADAPYRHDSPGPGNAVEAAAAAKAAAAAATAPDMHPGPPLVLAGHPAQRERQRLPLAAVALFIRQVRYVRPCLAHRSSLCGRAARRVMTIRLQNVRILDSFPEGT